MSKATTQRAFKQGLKSEETQLKRRELGLQLRKDFRLDKVNNKRSTIHQDLSSSSSSSSSEPPSAECSPCVEAKTSFDSDGKQFKSIKDFDVTLYGFSNLSELDVLIDRFVSTDYNQLDALTKLLLKLREVTTSKGTTSITCAPTVQVVGRPDVIFKLLECIKRCPSLVNNAVWTLINISNGTKEQVQMIMDQQPWTLIKQLLQFSASNTGFQDVIYLMGNMTSDHERFRQQFMDHGVFHTFVNMTRQIYGSEYGLLTPEHSQRAIEYEQKQQKNQKLQQQQQQQQQPEGDPSPAPLGFVSPNILHLSLLRDVTWAMSQFINARMHLLPLEDLTIAMPFIASVLQFEDKEIISSALDMIFVITRHDRNNQYINLLLIYPSISDSSSSVLRSSLLQRLIQLMVTSPNLKHKNLATHILGQVSGGTDEQTNYLLQAGILRGYQRVLEDYRDRPPPTTSKKAANEQLQQLMFGLSNLLAGTNEQFRFTIESPVLGLVENLWTPGIQYKLETEIIWVLTNCCLHDQSKKYYSRLLNQTKLINILSFVVREPTKPLATIKCCLKAFNAIAKFLHTNNHHQPGIPPDLNHFIEILEEYQVLDAMERLVYHDNSEISDEAKNFLSDYCENQTNELDSSISQTNFFDTAAVQSSSPFFSFSSSSSSSSSVPYSFSANASSIGNFPITQLSSFPPSPSAIPSTLAPLSQPSHVYPFQTAPAPALVVENRHVTPDFSHSSANSLAPSFGHLPTNFSNSSFGVFDSRNNSTSSSSSNRFDTAPGFTSLSSSSPPPHVTFNSAFH